MGSSENGPKIILDTNIMYYLCGLSPVPSDFDISKLSSFIREKYQEYNFAISSVSFYEFVMHNRKHAGILRRACSTMRNYHIRIYNDPYLPIRLSAPYNLTKIRQHDVQQVIDSFITQKIDVESRFAAAIFMIVLISVIAFEAFPDGKYNSNTISLLSAVSSLDKDVAVACLKDAYGYAYALSNPEEVIRDSFQWLLQFLLPQSGSVCKKLADMKAEDDMSECFRKISEQELHDARLQIEKAISKKGRTPTAFVSKKARQFGRSIGDRQLTDFLSNLWATLANVDINSESIREYTFEIIQSILLNGSSFRKNDINDSMILGSMSAGDCIVTCDKKMLEHMEKYKGTHPDYTRSLLLLQKFLAKT